MKIKMLKLGYMPCNPYDLYISEVPCRNIIPSFSPKAGEILGGTFLSLALFLPVCIKLIISTATLQLPEWKTWKTWIL